MCRDKEKGRKRESEWKKRKREERKSRRERIFIPGVPVVAQ